MRHSHSSHHDRREFDDKKSDPHEGIRQHRQEKGLGLKEETSWTSKKRSPRENDDRKTRRRKRKEHEFS
jgi:fatty-acid desaturase